LEEASVKGRGPCESEYILGQASVVLKTGLNLWRVWKLRPVGLTA